MRFNDAVVLPDKYAHTTANPSPLIATFDRAYLIAPSSLEWQVLEDWSWMDEGGVLVRTGVGSAGTDEFEATMKSYQNLVASRCNANTFLTGIQ